MAVTPFQTTPTDEDASLRQILSRETLALYGNSNKRIWVNKPDAFERMRAHAASHGIHDTFIKLETLQALIASGNKTLADQLMTESIIRTAKEISPRGKIGGFAKTFADIMRQPNQDNAARELEVALDQIGPQNAFYNNMRNQYKTIAEKDPNDPKIASLSANMSRVRREGHIDQIPDNTFVINVASGKGTLRIGDTVVNTRVIIGKGMTPEGLDKSTPIKKGKVQFLELQPNWIVPGSIATYNEWVKKIPELLASGATSFYEPSMNKTIEFNAADGKRFVEKYGTNITVKDKQILHEADAIFWQKAGPNCPVGAFKGGMEGFGSVRMHETTVAARANSFENAAQSSGCIRIEKIAEVADALCADADFGRKNGFPDNKTFFKAVMEPSEDGKSWKYPQFQGMRVPIKQGIGFQTEYKTVTPDGKIHKDIYKRDKIEKSRYAMPQLDLDNSNTRVAATTTSQAIPNAPTQKQGSTSKWEIYIPKNSHPT